MKLDEHECLKWCFGDLLSNSIRGKVAEFIVAKALNVAEAFQQEWDSFDLKYKDAGVEVKSSAYLQSWDQKTPSKIGFDIAPRRQRWDYTTNNWVLLDPPQRVADIYVFCVFKENNRRLANPLDTDQWVFHVLSRTKIDEKWMAQKRLSYSPLERVAAPATFDELRMKVDNILLANQS